LSEYRDYENGVADVLAFLTGGVATVDRNIRVLGHRSGRQRQIDVAVRGRIFGLTNGLFVVDCKRWTSRIDVKDVESFISFLDDVGADVGLLVTTQGFTDGGRRRARQERGIQLEVMTLEELRSWCPKGTISTTYRLPLVRRADAEKALRNAGFRVIPDSGYQAADDQVVLQVMRHYGVSNPSANVQWEHSAHAEVAFAKIGVEVTHVAHGVTMGGGTPAHRWLEVAVGGTPVGLKVLVANQADIERQLDHLAAMATFDGIPREAFSVITQEDWPVQDFFSSLI
jgi:hypothetical protein